MNQKELSEIRRRFRPEKSDMVRIRGCYVNEKKEFVSQFHQTIGMLSLMEADDVLKLLRKTLSGTLGKHLMDIEFSTQQVMEGEAHALLMDLRKTGLEDDAVAEAFFRRIAAALTLEGNYLILLAYDRYDVPVFHKDGAKAEDSFEEFPFLVCGVCPVKINKPALSYSAHEGRFRNLPADHIVSAPELGFLFPAFDDRSANIYNAVYYSRSITENHGEFADAIFGSPVPMPAAAQKAAFDALLAQTVSEDCSYEVARAVHEQLSELIEAHKADKTAEPLTVSKEMVSGVLASCGVSEARMAAFEARCDEAFGPDAALRPQNLVDVKQFELRTPDICIKLAPERSDLIETRLLNGRKYILIRADEGVEVNGVPIQIR